MNHFSGGTELWVLGLHGLGFVVGAARHLGRHHRRCVQFAPCETGVWMPLRCLRALPNHQHRHAEDGVVATAFVQPW